MPNPRDYVDTGAVRYGVSTAEKERLARERTLPGAPEDRSENQEAADRFAAGFLFGFHYPQIAPYIQTLVNRVKTSDLPVFGGSSPELQSHAVHGMEMGILERAKGTTLEDLLR